MDIERRGFIQGVFAGVVAGSSALIVEASPADVTALALRQHDPLILDRRPPQYQPGYSPIGPGEPVFNAAGQHIGYMTELSVYQEHEEDYVYGNQYRYPTLRRWEFRGTGVGPFVPPTP